MIDQLPCPIPGCRHSCARPNQQFSSQSTLLCQLNQDNHQTTYHLANQSICSTVGIYSCTQQDCPTAPTRFFYSLHKLTQHNIIHHPLPPTQLHTPTELPPTIPTTALNISTSIFYADCDSGSHNLWDRGISFILNTTNHHPPNFQSTWHCHLKHRNHSNFLCLQDHTVQAITTGYALSIDSTPFWWLLFHLNMLVLAPSTDSQRSHKSIHKTIRNRINSILSGDIEYVYNIAMTCTRHSQNNTPTSIGHNHTTQKAADSDQFRTAIAQATTSTSVAPIDNSNSHIVKKLYSTQPVPTQGHSPSPRPSQSYALPGNICTTILHASRNKGAKVNADSIDIFIDLVQAQFPSTSKNLNFIFQQIYQNNLPPPIR
jgi:hypothetical protein